MSSKLIINIRGLAGCSSPQQPLRGKELSVLPIFSNAYLFIRNGRIDRFGEMKDMEVGDAVEVYDAEGQYVLPCWCDSHTHMVFATSREEEFVDKIRGKTYAEIAANGGGILNSVARIAAATEDELYESASQRLNQLMRMGTGAIEIKGGYGLSTASEIKMLRVAKRLKENFPIPIRTTFLGAHTYPLNYRENHEGYIDLLINEMLPIIENERLADYIDVFCEDGFFWVPEMITIVNAGLKRGLRPKIHVNQLHSIGGLKAAVDLGAISVDHLETMTDQDISDLAASATIGTLLPSAAFFLRMNYQPARKMIYAGSAIALASDFNPGSFPSGNMNFVVSLACIQLKMLPNEAINAATINGAFAMEVADECGTIAPGKRANLIFTNKIRSLEYLPYAFGDNNIDRVMINGEFLQA